MAESLVEHDRPRLMGVMLLEAQSLGYFPASLFDFSTFLSAMYPFSYIKSPPLYIGKSCVIDKTNS